MSVVSHRGYEVFARLWHIELILCSDSCSPIAQLFRAYLRWGQGKTRVETFSFVAHAAEGAADRKSVPQRADDPPRG